MPFLRKYAAATAAGTHVGIPMVKAGSQDFATGADWTVAPGDVKVSIDGGAQANITTPPAYSNGQWLFTLTAAELTGKSVRVAVVDSAPKAVEDQFFTVETFGHAAALFTVDFTAAGGKVPATVAAGDMAADSITAAAVAAAAVTKVQAGLSTYAGGPVASVTGPVTVGTNNDKTGYGLSAAAVDAVWDELHADHNTIVGSFGRLLDAAVSSVSGGAGGSAWDELLADHAGAGSFGAAVAALARPGDAMTLDLSQTGLTPRSLNAVADSALTVGDALVCAIAGAAGKEAVAGTTYTVKTPSTGTVVRSFALDSATAPTSRQ